MIRTGFFLILFLSGCNKEPALPVLYTQGAGVTDIDGNSYNTILINGQEWMASNLRTTRYCDETPINELTTKQEILYTSEGGWSYYEFDATNENPHGKLYNGYAVTDNRNPCPCGWRVPSNEDWDQLITFLGGKEVAGDKMKLVSNEYPWAAIENNQDANRSGFSAFPSGSFSTMYGGAIAFGGMSHQAMWWSSSQVDSESSWSYNIVQNSTEIVMHQYSGNNTNLRSIRCIKE